MLVAFSLASPVVIIPSWFGSQNYSLGTSCLYAVSLSKEKKNKKKKRKMKIKSIINISQDTIHNYYLKKVFTLFILQSIYIKKNILYFDKRKLNFLLKIKFHQYQFKY